VMLTSPPGTDGQIRRWPMCRTCAEKIIAEYDAKGKGHPALTGWHVEPASLIERGLYEADNEQRELARVLREHRERPVQGALEI